MNIESLAGFINDGGSNRTRTRNTSSNNTCRNGHFYHHLSLHIPDCAEFLSFFIEKIPVSFRISGFFGSITSRCRGGSDILAERTFGDAGVVVSITSRCRGGSDQGDAIEKGYQVMSEFQSPRGVGVVQTLYSGDPTTLSSI